MRWISPRELELTHFCLFAGMGGLSLGLDRGCARIGQTIARMRCLGGVDAWPAACRDFRTVTGSPCAELDLFDEADYRAFHGREPPAGWREATAQDIRDAAGGECPDILATSPPCKGFSGLLSGAAAASERYQALNRLVPRGLLLALEAFADDPPALVLLENVPRIQTRGRALLDDVEALLRGYGYAVAETTHDCGELGGLAQHRRRFLLVARHTKKVRPFLYEPPRQRVRAIGEALEQLPMPEASGSGPMHRLPRLEWLTWLRLALIPAGRDWRALRELAVVNGVLRDIGILPLSDWRGDVLGVRPWGEPSGTVTGRGTPTTGAFAVADPRPARELGRYQPLGVVPWDEPGRTVTAQAAPGAGPYSVADPRLPGVHHNNILRLVRWDEPSRCVTGGRCPTSGGMAVADPRMRWTRKERGDWSTGGHYAVVPWSDPSGAVIAHARHDRGPWTVADPRLPAPSDRPDPVPLVEALDGTWHRPLTTFELAHLQGYPVFGADGRPLALDGASDSAWRERIGNSVPPPAARAIADEMARTLLLETLGETFRLSNTPIWVQPFVTALSVASEVA